MSNSQCLFFSTACAADSLSFFTNTEKFLAKIDFVFQIKHV